MCCPGLLKTLGLKSSSCPTLPDSLSYRHSPCITAPGFLGPFLSRLHVCVTSSRPGAGFSLLFMHSLGLERASLHHLKVRSFTLPPHLPLRLSLPPALPRSTGISQRPAQGASSAPARMLQLLSRAHGSRGRWSRPGCLRCHCSCWKCSSFSSTITSHVAVCF